MSGPRSLVLNGSPNAAGNGAHLAGLILDALDGPFESVFLYERKIIPCRDCGVCAAGGNCPLVDDMAQILNTLFRSDVVLLVSPLHFTSLSAPLVAFISRLQPFWQAEKAGWSFPLLTGQRRRGGLVVTAGSEYPGMFEPARAVGAAAFKTLGIRFDGMVAAASTDQTPAAENSIVVADAKWLAEKMLERVGRSHSGSGVFEATEIDVELGGIRRREGVQFNFVEGSLVVVITNGLRHEREREIAFRLLNGVGAYAIIFTGDGCESVHDGFDDFLVMESIAHGKSGAECVVTAWSEDFEGDDVSPFIHSREGSDKIYVVNLKSDAPLKERVVETIMEELDEWLSIPGD